MCAAADSPGEGCHLCILQLACIIQLLPVAQQGLNISIHPTSQLLLQPLILLLLLGECAATLTAAQQMRSKVDMEVLGCSQRYDTCHQ